MKLNINEKINLHELLFDIALMVSQYIYSLLSKDKMAIANMNDAGIIVSILIVSLFFTYYIARLARTFKAYSDSININRLYTAVTIIYFIVGTILACGTLLYLTKFGYLKIESDYVEAILFISTILLVITGFSMGLNIGIGILLLFIFIFIFVWIGGTYFIFDFCVRYFSAIIPSFLIKIIGFVYMFGLPISFAVLLFKITDNHKDDIKKIKFKLIDISESLIFKLLSTIFFSLLLSFWAEIYYGIVMEQIESGAGRIAYLFFSGVIPVRFLLLIEPPFRPANLFFGSIAILVFVLRYI